MRIVTPTEIEQVAWQGALEPLGEAYRHGVQLPKVTLGEPVEWFLPSAKTTGESADVPLPPRALCGGD